MHINIFQHYQTVCVMLIVQAERMIRVLLIAVVAVHTCRCWANAGTNVNDVVRDIRDSICQLNFFEQAYLYLDFCADDGFSRCNEIFYSPENINDSFAIVSLTCNSNCPRETDANVVWNIHLFSENYDITVSCRNGSCTSRNEDTELLALEQDFTTFNSTLGFRYNSLYQDSLVGCIITTDNCTENHYWVINGGGVTGGDTKIYNPANEATYYTALGENLVISCEAYSDHQASVSWHKGQTNVIQFTQHCQNFDETYSSNLCIMPSLDDYQKERVRSRVFALEECRGQTLTNNSLDIAVADWTDNGSSYSCVSRTTEFSDITEEVYQINVVVDVIPEFTQLPAPYSVHSSISDYSCVAKAGWGAKLQWVSDDVIPEHDPNDINLPSVYVTYSMNNVSTVLTAKNTNYTGDPINSVYPVHTATLHFSGTPYHGQSRKFTCVITGVNVQFLQHYNVPDDNLMYSMTVYIP